MTAPGPRTQNVFVGQSISVLLNNVSYLPKYKTTLYIR
jgi:hypothetical protein